MQDAKRPEDLVISKDIHGLGWSGLLGTDGAVGVFDSYETLGGEGEKRPKVIAGGGWKVKKHVFY